MSTGWGQTSSEFGYIDSSFAESTKNYNNRNLILKINPLALISGDIPFYTGEYRLVAEWVTSHKTSVTIGVSYLTMSIAERILTELDTTFKNAGGSTWDYAVNGYRIQAGFRYYLKPQGLKISDPKFNPAPKGPYIFALGSYSSARSYERAYKDEYLLFTHWSVTMNFGYQILMGEKMTLDPYVGFGYKNNTVYDNKNKIPPKGLLETPEMQFIYGNHLKVNIGINLGFRF
ncbi:MAG: hypothetical protein ACPGEG_05110 [Salibacteraceae bacterium]